MRKIEQQMNAALANSKNWQSGNTSVHFNEENNTSVVRLHGNKIAVLGDDFLEIFDGGWQTNTTKSRLNAIINRFCNGVTDGVFQKNYEWFVRDNNVTKEFTNGYIFAWYKMITSKAQMLRIMKNCDGADTLTREEKFQVFVKVCDNMLADGRMTKATHKRFTHIW